MVTHSLSVLLNWFNCGILKPGHIQFCIYSHHKSNYNVHPANFVGISPIIDPVFFHFYCLCLYNLRKQFTLKKKVSDYETVNKEV